MKDRIGVVPLSEVNNRMNNVQLVQSLPYRESIGVDVDKLQRVLRRSGFENRLCVIELRQEDVFVSPRIASFDNGIAQAEFTTQADRSKKLELHPGNDKVGLELSYTSQNAESLDGITKAINSRLNQAFVVFPVVDYRGKLSGDWMTQLEAIILLKDLCIWGSALVSFSQRHSGETPELFAAALGGLLAGRYLDYLVINSLSLGIGMLASEDRLPLHIGEPVVAYFKDRIFYPKDIGKMIFRTLSSSVPLILFGGEEYFRKI